jgi:2-octaprenyl-6-methoxyphenol hydroxylase
MTFDVAIIGAGLNGLTTALALGSTALMRPLSVILIDGKEPAPGKSDTRGSALTRATQNMLQVLGVWEQLKPLAEEMRYVMVTDGGKPVAERPALMRFATEEGKCAAAAIVENGDLLEVLRNAVTASPVIQNFGVAVANVSFGPGLAKVTLADGSELKASLVVGADGRASRTRELAGIAVNQKDYGQSAFTFTITHELAHGGEAQEHFLPHGVLAVLPLTGARSSIVWATSRAEAEQLMALDDGAFTAAFQEKLENRLGRVALATARSCYPLALITAKEMIAPRLALVGDAAHVIHPLAGLGLNLGFKDAASLAEVIHEAAGLGEDIGALAVLERYAQQRRFDTLMTTFSIDALNSLFTNANPLLSAMRGLGLQIMDRMPYAKALFMQEAAGLTGSPPKLMRGLRV